MREMKGIYKLSLMMDIILDMVTSPGRPLGSCVEKDSTHRANKKYISHLSTTTVTVETVISTTYHMFT